MSWQGRLQLRYQRDDERTIAHDRHHGPLRVLQRLYPEGPGVCHHVLVHPPGGIAGGDVLHIDADLQPHTHALITTPGATRFYKSADAQAEQHLNARVAEGARLEWLPLETIAYRGCQAHNRMRFELAPGAEMIGWDVLALGLPAAGEHFDDPAWAHGHYTQEIELPGVWLERGTVRASDQRLLDSPLGWAGRRVMGTVWFAAGTPLSTTERGALLDAARAVLDDEARPTTHGLCGGATSPDAQLVVVRVLAERVEPIMQRLTAIWQGWRQTRWRMEAPIPRIWRM